MCGRNDTVEYWNRQQQQFSNVPPASIDEYKFLFQWYDHWLKNAAFFAFVELLDVWFAVEGSSEAWGGGSSVVIEVGLNLDLAGTTFVGFHPPPVCTGSQLALPSLPCQSQGSVRPFWKQLLSADIPLLPVCSLPRASPNCCSVQFHQCQLCLKRNSK